MSPKDAETLQLVRDKLAEKGKGCGECTACCTLLAVDMRPVAQAPKPERVKCTYVCKAGCSIYGNKPESCTVFICMWLATQMFDDEMPERWRPDKVGAVVDVNELGVITAHLKHEVAFEREGPLRDMLNHMTTVESPIHDARFAVLDRPSGNHLLYHKGGRTEVLVACGIGPAGHKQYRTKFPGEA